MQYTPNLGEVPAEDARDAVHVAVAPVVAGVMTLKPGDHVYLSPRDGLAYHADDQSGDIGIVDPFLADGPRKGGRFWLFLYPNTTTSLRHVWTHPAFTPKIPGKDFSHD